MVGAVGNYVSIFWTGGSEGRKLMSGVDEAVIGYGSEWRDEKYGC